MNVEFATSNLHVNSTKNGIYELALEKYKVELLLYRIITNQLEIFNSHQNFALLPLVESLQNGILKFLMIIIWLIRYFYYKRHLNHSKR